VTKPAATNKASRDGHCSRPLTRVSGTHLAAWAVRTDHPPGVTRWTTTGETLVR